MDKYTAVMIAEGVEPASEERKLEAWQMLIDTGLAWQLQGYFGRGAEQLIRSGVCRAPRRES
jgi:hypothetical protein